MGRKVSDRFTVPLCRLHHRELHRRGSERLWWENKGIDPLPIAATLWMETHTEGTIETTTVTHANEATGFNGLHVTGGVLGVAVRDQNDETKPILRPEAG